MREVQNGKRRIGETWTIWHECLDSAALKSIGSAAAISIRCLSSPPGTAVRLHGTTGLNSAFVTESPYFRWNSNGALRTESSADIPSALTIGCVHLTLVLCLRCCGARSSDTLATQIVIRKGTYMAIEKKEDQSVLN